MSDTAEVWDWEGTVSAALFPFKFIPTRNTKRKIITTTVKTPMTTSAIIKCKQSGGAPTGELDTGSWYILENWTQENGWKEMPYVIDGEIGWTAEAWMIPMDSSCEWETNWEWLYGQIPAGKYRIGKEITDFRGPGDYDKAIYYAEFSIE